jgi:hypothetical protein
MASRLASAWESSSMEGLGFVDCIQTRCPGEITGYKQGLLALEFLGGVAPHSLGALDTLFRCRNRKEKPYNISTTMVLTLENQKSPPT